MSEPKLKSSRKNAKIWKPSLKCPICVASMRPPKSNVLCPAGYAMRYMETMPTSIMPEPIKRNIVSFMAPYSFVMRRVLPHISISM